MKNETESSQFVAKRVLEKEAKAILYMAQNIPEDFAPCIDVILKCSGRVVVSGIGKSGHIGRKLSATLASTGTPSCFMHAAEASHGDLGMLSQNDICLLISNSGETAELIDIVAYSKRFAITLIGISSNAQTALMKAADYRLTLPKISEACATGLVPTTSTTLMLALGDALAVALMERRNFCAEHFHAFHPGGKLGSKLITVEQLMHVRADLAIVEHDLPMKEVLIEMTCSGFGVAIVEQKSRLLGIITDGDLRRNVDKIFSKTAGTIATLEPGTISTTSLASTALNRMQKDKVYSLIVNDKDDRVLGLIRMHNLLQAGLI